MQAFKKVDILMFFISIFAIGLFNDYLSCIASVVFAVRLVFIIVKNKRFVFRLNPVILSVGVIEFMYLISPIWAVDSGMAFIGFFKYLPALLFLLVAQQNDYNDEFINLLPIVATVMTAFSTVFAFVPVVKEFFTVSGRLSGFFQYSNTYALFVLVALLILLYNGVAKWYELLYLAVMFFGIFYSGSRTVFILALIAVPAVILHSKNKKLILSTIAIFAVMILGALIYVAISGNFDTIGRFLTVSLKESTFLGRILYYKDALPIILKHPFGMGYMGYYFSQRSFQTGVYSVMFVHNDFLQFTLDIGWLPTVMLVFAICKAFFKKGQSFLKRVLILIVCAHSCFDFNFAFVSFFILFLLLLDYNDGKEFLVNKISSLVGVFSVLAVLSLYFAIAQFLSYLKLDSLALAMYPANTVSETRLLTETEDIDELYDIAVNINKRNKYVSVAYSAISRYYYSKGDFENVMEYKRLAFDYAPYEIEDYKEYCYMLIMGIQLYERAGDTKSADYCRFELADVPERLGILKENTDELGFKIKDKPDFNLGEEIEKYISKIDVNIGDN